jgi:HlyD family secretion protein
LPADINFIFCENMRRILVVLFIVIVVIAAAFFFLRQRRTEREQDVEIIREAVVERGKITSTVNAAGSIEPQALVNLSFGLGGIVQDINVVRGQSVSSGDLLASLETDELALAVQQAQDGLRIQELTKEQLQNSGPSAATLATAQADIDAAEGNLAIAKANLKAAEASLDQTKAQKAQLLAGPTDGQIATAESQIASAELQQKNADEAHEATMRCFTVSTGDGGSRKTCPSLGPAEEQARANLENTNAALVAAQAQLADLRTGPSVADLEVSGAAIAAAEAQVESGRGSVVVAEANLARSQAAYDRLLEPPNESEVAILEAQVNSGRTNLALAQLRFDQAQVSSPIDGQVASLRISKGEQVAPGLTAIVVLDEDAFHTEVRVDEIDIDLIDEGQEVEIILDALPDTPVIGIITEIAPIADSTGSGVVTYLVTINIDSDDVTLRPGMTANASITVEEMEDVIIVPNWAVRLDRETGQAFVNRLRPDNSIEEVIVITGLRNDQFSQILSGLQEGDVVVVTDQREGFSFFGN